jgi:hypothetical protein
MNGTHEQERMCFIKEKDIIIVAKENALTVKHLDIKLNIFIKDLTTLKRL